MKKYLIIMILGLTSIHTYSQIMTPSYDKSKHYQLRSMETGPWDFYPPAWYYSFWNYKGSFLGFKFNLRLPGLGIHDRGFAAIGGGDQYIIKYRPNQKLRAMMLVQAIQSNKSYKKYATSILEIQKRESIDAIDRKFDLVLQDYSPMFKALDKVFMSRMKEYRQIYGNNKHLYEYAVTQKKIQEVVRNINHGYISNIDRSKAYLEQFQKYKELISTMNRSLQTKYMLIDLGY